MSIINISSHQPQKEEKYFLDCNVLMYEFYTNGSYAQRIVQLYNSFINKLLCVKAEIVFTDVLLSEFINAYIRAEFNRIATLNGLPNNRNYFKRTFRNSRSYKIILQELELIINRQILPISTRFDTPFSSFSTASFFNNAKTFDFNDRYYGWAMSVQGA